MSVPIEKLRQRLPEGWGIDRRPEGRARFRLLVVSPDGRKAEMTVLRRDRIVPRDVVAMQLRSASDGLPDLVIAPYLSPEVRRRLVEAGIGYADATGNLRLTLTDPGLFIETVGADRNPNPEKRPARSLSGPKAGRIVRAVCERTGTWGVRELAEATDTNPGYVSRLLALLVEEALVLREARGPVSCPDWRRLLERWAESAPLETRGRSQMFIAPRGIDAMVGRLKGLALPHAVTGSLAANRVAPVAPARLATLYVEVIDIAALALEIRPTDMGANVLLIEPKDQSLVGEGRTDTDGICWTPLTQVACDLLTSTGRGPAEAVALMEWMANNEEVWRG